MRTFDRKEPKESVGERVKLVRTKALSRWSGSDPSRLSQIDTTDLFPVMLYIRVCVPDPRDPDVWPWRLLFSRGDASSLVRPSVRRSGMLPLLWGDGLIWLVVLHSVLYIFYHSCFLLVPLMVAVQMTGPNPFDVLGQALLLVTFFLSYFWENVIMDVFVKPRKVGLQSSLLLAQRDSSISKVIPPLRDIFVPSVYTYQFFEIPAIHYTWNYESIEADNTWAQCFEGLC
jgi:hypothetical protein